MKVAIMQPYFFPYIGYFQLINAVDEFVIYDNIQFTKKGWINRNRILINGKDDYITLPLKKDSDFLQVYQRCLADTWESDRKKMLNRIKESYRKTPYFDTVFPVIEECILFEDQNLFNFILHSVQQINEYLNIKTPLITASTIPMDHELKAESKVIEICKSRKANIYINPSGGVGLYSKNNFADHGIILQFIKSIDIEYKQFDKGFVPWLSIIDVMMFNSKDQIADYLDSFYTLN
ncbi:WbqC family protein [Agriterribacter sp.]|uniref:WbqC family protein n=1 Tax=Agriterribacter sp. TaxID=2821509 RepID=UPI002CF84CD3|nr:WbqC family protein [Agriterribacter sp.]HTN06099.1 WbqC family protein [Agriterribacter sp.]